MSLKVTEDCIKVWILSFKSWLTSHDSNQTLQITRYDFFQAETEIFSVSCIIYTDFYLYTHSNASWTIHIFVINLKKHILHIDLCLHIKKEFVAVVGIRNVISYEYFILWYFYGVIQQVAWLFSCYCQSMQITLHLLEVTIILVIKKNYIWVNQNLFYYVKQFVPDQCLPCVLKCSIVNTRGI